MRFLIKIQRHIYLLVVKRHLIRSIVNNGKIHPANKDIVDYMA